MTGHAESFAGLRRGVAVYIVAWYAALAFLIPFGGWVVAVVNLAYFALGAITSAVLWRTGTASGDPRLRRALRLMAVAHALVTANGFVWTYWQQAVGVPFSDSVNRLTDVAYVPFLCASFLSFPVDPGVRWRDARVRVDGALFAVGALALSWHFAVAPMLAGGDELSDALVQGIEWLATIAASVALLRARDRHIRRIIGVALAAHILYIITDYFWVRVVLDYAPGHWVDALWFGAWVLRWGAALRAIEAVQARPTPHRSTSGSLAPSLFVAAAYALLLLAFAVEGGRSTLDVVVAAALMTVLLIVRQWITLHENAGLATETARQAAVFRTLVASASDLVLLVRDDRRIAYASPSAERVLGPVDGLAFGALLHPADRTGALEWLEERATSLGVRAYRCRLRAPEGTWRDIELRAQDRRDDPAVEGFVLNARDVSQETALEQALGHSRKLAMLSEMAGRIAHSFNNTLAALQVHAEVLARDLPEGALAREDARAIGAAAERGAGITRQLLGFSGRHVIRPVPVEPAQILEALRPTFAQLLGPMRTCVLRVDAPSATVLLDRAQLEQVLVNLVANARDAIPVTGTVTLRVAAEPPAGGDGAQVLIEVTDDGTGIAPEHLARVFEPFFSTKSPGRGTGLGLAMVASIIRRAGGTVEMCSTVGIGTTARIRLPAHRRISSPVLVVDAVEAAPASTARILLVDDDALVRRASTRMLTRSGFAVVDAEDGARALAIAEDPAERIDLLITDLMMPGLSGREVVARFRVLRPGTPIICVTGYATEREDDQSLAQQVNAIIAKPFTTTALTQAIAAALRGDSDER